MANVSQSLLRGVDDPNRDLQELQADLHDYLMISKDREIISQLVAQYLHSKTTRAIVLLAGLKDPYNRWFIERCADDLRQNESRTRTATLKLILCVVQRDPPWLHDIHPKIFKETLQILKEGADLTACFICIVVMATILPLIPGAFDKRTLETTMFRAFTCTAELCLRSKENFAELNRQHLCSGLFTLYKVLYAMFPCNFLAHFRATYGSSDNPESMRVWRQIILPMIRRTFFHPHLIQYNCESETHKDRWRGQQKHDIIADCQTYFSEPRNELYIESVRPKFSASKPRSIPKSSKIDTPSSGGVLSKAPNLLDIMTTHPPSDVSSSLGSVDIAEEANPENPMNASEEVSGCTPKKQRKRGRSSLNLPVIPSAAMKEEHEEHSAVREMTQRSGHECTNSSFDNTVVDKESFVQRSDMENMLVSGLRHRFASHALVTSQQTGHLTKLMRSMSCPAAPSQIKNDDSVCMSETSSNEDLSSKCLSLSLWPNSPEPRRMKELDVPDDKSPGEILEDHMKACAILVLKEQEYHHHRGQLTKEQVGLDDILRELTYTKAHSTMLYVELLYDRHRKEIHIERNRRLLEKAKRIIQLEEKNTALAEQAKEIRGELRSSAFKIAELQHLLEMKDGEAQHEVSDMLDKTRKREDENRRLLFENEEVNLKNADQCGKLDEAKAQLHSLESELHAAKLKLETERSKTEELVSHKEKSTQLEQELITVQEMYQRLEEKYRSQIHDCGQASNKDELTKELKQCRARLEHRKQESEAALERYRIQQDRAAEAERVLKEKQAYLFHLETNTVEQIRAKDEHINALRRSQERLHSCIMQLQSKLDESEAFNALSSVPDHTNSQNISASIKETS